MKLSFIFLFLTFFVISCDKNQSNKLLTEDKIKNENFSPSTEEITDKDTDVSIPTGLNKLLIAYPDFINSVDDEYLYFKDGEKLTWDDGKKKTFDEMIENPDLEDMMSIQYPPGRIWESPPGKNFDPGRIRVERFFKKMYGHNESEVRENCVSLDWFGTSILVTKINEVDKKLEEVKKELQNLSQEFQKYFNKTGGTFNWRFIANTKRLSTHSFATAIDINTDFSDYWEWNKNLEYKNRIPIEIVEIFEKYGFIWGGKWYHYDTMHFEYRPELLN
jgi:peptidoglycan LD-endopeptidase CwlK